MDKQIQLKILEGRIEDMEWELEQLVERLAWVKQDKVELLREIEKEEQNEKGD